MKKILIVEDDTVLARSLKKALSRSGYDVQTCERGREAIERIEKNNVKLVLLDNRLPDTTGLEILRQIREGQSKFPVIMMTAFGTEETAIQAMKCGAYDYIVKPFDIDELERIIAKGIEDSRLMDEIAFYPFVGDIDLSAGRIIGNSKKMQDVYKLIGQVTEADITVLIRGESGTGKELVARAIYHHSRRKDKPFLAVNCAAIPETLLESELFGYEKGAFTGAMKRRIGKFEQCHQGTIFLDEIGDMSLATQAKVLRVLQDGEFERIGGEEKIKVDVRVITATNKPLDEYIRQGLFRDDLYYRLEAVTITIPPLRERPEDIRELAGYFFQHFRKNMKSHVKMMSPAVIKKLQEYHWPGNVRELINTIMRALVLATGDVLTVDHLLLGGGNEGTPPTGVGWERSLAEGISGAIKGALLSSERNLYARVINEAEKILIGSLMKEMNGNQVRVAGVLGISRNTLRQKIKQFAI
ncbi:MAG: sigma-54 dependent transcriptional regulator [Syntrophales bacterium]|nr:sigma-54 dependent transcriptional regulator [Syntrophales bacterium]